MNRKALNIGYLTSTDANDKRSWSGTHYYMAKALERNCGNVTYLGPVNPKFAITKGRAFSFLSQKLLGKRYDYSHSVSLSKTYGQLFTDILKHKKCDIIFAPSSSSKIAFLNTQIPIVYLSDATFDNMLNYYPAYSNLRATSIKQGNEIEHLALYNSAISLFPSHWAAKSAIDIYGADKSKVHIVPFGANIDSIPLREDVIPIHNKKVCRLLFLGVNWERKGGEIAFNTFEKLNQIGIETELTVCGCIPPSNFTHKRMNVIPFLDKNKTEDMAIFKKLLSESTFLLLPSRSECFGIVFAEASAYALPSIAAETGGIADVINHGVNGFLLPYTATTSEYASLIKSILSSNEKHCELKKTTRDLFEKNLNWDTWANQVKELIKPLV
jgi:glycosyltransferase involved in cell wall biosynthesis